MTRPVGVECDRSSDCMTGYCSFSTKGGPKCEFPKLYSSCNPGYCPTGSTCITGVCRRDEATKITCSATQYYEDGKCHNRKWVGKSCVFNKECLNSSCYLGKCAKKCSGASDCPSWEMCSGGYCQKKDHKGNSGNGTDTKYENPTYKNPTYKNPTYKNPTYESNDGPSTVVIVAGCLGLLAILILIIWASYRCCCKSSKTKGNIVQPVQPIVVQQAPPYPSMQSPYVAAPPQSPYMPSSPQYHSQSPNYYEGK